jgi:hypothetical protein
MAGYAAFGTVVRGRVAAFPTVEWPSSCPAETTADEAGAAMIDAGASEAVATPGTRIRDRLATAREQWAITTFFLFDPNSWR